ncbi:MAG: hypothetical protein FIB03_00755 [Anaerolineae bacterium]|nr:hypothetical protein [Anaerolineae bacterium]
MNFNALIEPERPDPEARLTRRAVLWGREDMLSQSVSLFLEIGKIWEVVRVSNDGDIGSLTRKIKAVRPEVVILCMDRVNGDSSLPLRLINERLCFRVVTLSLENNVAQVYSKQNLIIRGVRDLLSIIEPENSSNCTPGKEVG